MASEDQRDRRIQRTEAALNAALMELIRAKGYDKVTVQDIIDRANVGRSTFYSHYETKHDLLVSQLGHLTKDLDAHLAAATAQSGPLLPALGLFVHVAQHRPMFERLLGSRGIDLVEQAAVEMLRARALATIQEREEAGQPHPVDANVRAAFIAGALMAFVQWWLDEGLPCSPVEANAMYERLTESA